MGLAFIAAMICQSAHVSILTLCNPHSNLPSSSFVLPRDNKSFRGKKFQVIVAVICHYFPSCAIFLPSSSLHGVLMSRHFPILIEWRSDWNNILSEKCNGSISYLCNFPSFDNIIVSTLPFSTDFASLYLILVLDFDYWYFSSLTYML